MGEILREGIHSKYLALTGIVLALIGGLVFLNSLGSGGGYVATGLMIPGVALIIGAIVRGIAEVVSRYGASAHNRNP